MWSLGPRVRIPALALAAALASFPGFAWADACADAQAAVRERLSADPLAEDAADLFDGVIQPCAGSELKFAWYSQAIDSIGLGQFVAARRALDLYNAEQAARGLPADHQIAARLAAAQGDWALAEAELMQVWAFYEARPDIITSGRAQVLEDRAEARLALNDPAGARALLEAAMAAREADQGPRHANVGDTVARLAEVALAEGDTERAVALYREALTYYTGANVRHLGRIKGPFARALVRAGRLDEAEAEAQEAVRLDAPGYSGQGAAREHRRTLAYVLGARGDFDAASAALGPPEEVSARALDGGLADAIALADLFWQGRQYPYAGYYYRHAHMLASRNHPVGYRTRVTLLANAANAWLLSGQPGFAIDDYRAVDEENARAAGPRSTGENFRRAQVLALWAQSRTVAG